MSSFIKPLFLVAALFFMCAGCGGKKGTIEIDIVTSPLDQNPFEGVSEARWTIGDKVKSVPVDTMGHFSFEFEQDPPNEARKIVLDGLDSMGTIRCHGETPPLNLTPVDQGPYAIWVARVETITAALAVLPEARTELASLGATGLGALFAGGRDNTGAARKNAVIYSVYNQKMIPVADMSGPRAGAVAISASPRGMVFGGSQATGFGAPATALGTGELFDPSTGTGIWTAVPAASAPVPFSQGHVMVLGSGQGLVTGGFGETGAALSSATLLSVGGTAVITPTAGQMVGHRVRHAGAPARFPDGDGALIIGGLADGDLTPACERFTGQSFTTFKADGVENRWDATASAMTGGVLLAGGTIADNGVRAATRSVIFIPTETAANMNPQRFDALLSVARAGHTATRVGADLLLCGGYDASNQLIASCDIIGTAPVALKRTLPMGTARKGHSAVQLETGIVLLAGGVGADGMPLASIEIYTPVP